MLIFLFQVFFLRTYRLRILKFPLGLSTLENLVRDLRFRDPFLTDSRLIRIFFYFMTVSILELFSSPWNRETVGLRVVG